MVLTLGLELASELKMLAFAGVVLTLGLELAPELKMLAAGARDGRLRERQRGHHRYRDHAPCCSDTHCHLSFTATLDVTDGPVASSLCDAAVPATYGLRF